MSPEERLIIGVKEMCVSLEKLFSYTSSIEEGLDCIHKEITSKKFLGAMNRMKRRKKGKKWKLVK